MRSIIITNMLFLSTNTLYFRERISLIKMRFFFKGYGELRYFTNYISSNFEHKSGHVYERLYKLLNPTTYAHG